MTIRLPEIHPHLGTPSGVYPYRDASGNVYAAAYRFDDSDGKTFRPYDAISKTWSFPKNPAPYRPKLSKSLNPDIPGNPEHSENQNPDIPSNPVIIVEGEKCADALASLGLPGITSFGGSGHPGKTDWSCLRGCDVIIWPDNDAPGLKYSEALTFILRNIGINSLRICNVETATIRKVLYNSIRMEKQSVAPLLKERFLKQVGGALLKRWPLKEPNDDLLKEARKPITSIENLPKGWDVADALKEGWQREHVRAFLKEAVSIETSPVSIENTANDNWPKPDLSILYRNPEPPAFPIEIFEGPMGTWLSQTAEGRAAPVDYVAGTLLSTVAALIGNSRIVSPWETWKEPCILWIALVGSPSSGKSPAMDPVLDQIKKLEQDEVPGHEEALRQYEADKLSAEVARDKWKADVKAANGDYDTPVMPESAIEPQIPQRPRLVIRDATTEALVQALQGQPKGLLMHRDELAGWFNNLDRYSGGKGGDRAFWLECFGGKAFTQDRVKNGANPIIVPQLSTSIIGSIQPEPLKTCFLKGDDDGLNSRFLYIYPNPVERRRPRHMADNKMMERTLRKLHALKMGIDEDHNPISRIIGLSQDASDTFEGWWKQQAKNAPEGKSSGWHGKLPGVALRLSLVLAYLEWAASSDAVEPHEISYLPISRAIKLIDDYLTPMAERAFGTIAKTDADQDTLKLANWIMETRPERISVRELSRGQGPFPSGTSKDVINAACLSLVGHNWLRPDYIRSGESAGRTQTAYSVNPSLLNGF
jgi:5S rRNA maturation endonuclease (ribonuclease M5)